MAKRTTSETATEAYTRLAADITKQIKDLEFRLQIHEGTRRNRPADWSYPGDLGHVRELLANAIEFLGSGK